MPSTELAHEGWRIGRDKTKVLSNGQSPQDNPTSTLKGWSLEAVDAFSYLGREVEQMCMAVEQMCMAEKDAKIRFEKSALSTKCGEGRCSGVKATAEEPKCRSFKPWSCQCPCRVQRPGR